MLGVIPGKGSNKIWLVGAIPILILAMFIGYVLLGSSLQAPRVQLIADEIRFDTRYLAQPIPRHSLSLEDARLVDSSKQTEYRIVEKENGVAISDYRVGWFRLSNGEKAFVSLDSGPEAVYLPTSSGYVILMDAKTGSALLKQLKENGNGA
ncbi:MAG: hypothetical protein AB7O54_07495 [Pseudomonadales bacterium]